MRKPVLFLIALCSLLHAQEAPKPTVLVAWEKTKFKQALVSEVEKQLTAAGCAVTRVDHSKHGLDSIKAASFDAVFITNSGAMAKVRPWIVEWLDKNKEAGSRILLHTTQITKWEPQVSVDAVTSASANKEAKALATEYAARVAAKAQKTAGSR
jgi:hypothetical protein